jgi:hypothetical protein
VEILNIEIDTDFHYVTPKFSGLLYEIAAQINKFELLILPSSQTDKYQFRVSHRTIGCIASIKQTGDDHIVLYDHINGLEHELSSADEFVSKFVNPEDRIQLQDFISKYSNAVNVSIEKSSDSVKSLVKLIQYLILSKGLAMNVSRLSLDKDMLLQFENNYNNSKSFTIHSDKVVDGSRAVIRDEIDIYLYLHIL